MSTTTFDLATQLGVLQVGRDPAQEAHSTPNELAPASSSEGAACLDSVVGLLGVDLRETDGVRTARLSIPTLTIGDSFTTTVDGNAVVYDSTGDADLDEVVADLADAINNDVTVGALVVALAVNSADDSVTPGSRDSVRVRGLASNDTDWTIDFTDNGTSVVAVSADPTTASMSVWVQRTAAPGSTASTRWRKLPTGYTLSSGGFMERFNVAGLARIYAQITAVDGPGGDGSGVTYRTPTLDWAPAIIESSS